MNIDTDETGEVLDVNQLLELLLELLRGPNQGIDDKTTQELKPRAEIAVEARRLADLSGIISGNSNTVESRTLKSYAEALFAEMANDDLIIEIWENLWRITKESEEHKLRSVVIEGETLEVKASVMELWNKLERA